MKVYRLKENSSPDPAFNSTERKCYYIMTIIIDLLIPVWNIILLNKNSGTDNHKT